VGLCLYVLDRDSGGDQDPEELAACDVGHYGDFGWFRETIARHVNRDDFPTLMLHSDCDGEWTLADIPLLETELRDIGSRLRQLPPEEPVGAFEHTADYRAGAQSLYDCFHDVNGENLIEALLGLCAAARQHGRPITFM
jgi:immunity protein 70 of polymorphic toxin system